MDKYEAAGLLDVIARSLARNPDQFSYSANVQIEKFIGFQVGGGQPGAPVNIESKLSGSAHTMVGAQFHSSLDVSQGDLEIAAGKANEEMRARISDAARIIEELAAEIRDNSSKSGGIADKLSALAQLTLPVLIVELVRAILQNVGVQGPSRNEA